MVMEENLDNILIWKQAQEERGLIDIPFMFVVIPTVEKMGLNVVIYMDNTMTIL
jgi:hypothetical protein